MQKGFRNPIIGLSSVQAGGNEAAVSPSTPGSGGYSLSDTSQASGTSSPSISPAPTPSSLDFRPLRPQRHSTGMMANSGCNGSSPSTPPITTPSAHTSPLAANCPSPCPSPTTVDYSKQPRASIARPRPRAISTGNLKVCSTALPPPSSRVHTSSPCNAGGMPVTPTHQHQSHSQANSPFPPSNLVPSVSMHTTSSPPPIGSPSVSLGPTSPQQQIQQPQQPMQIASPPRPSSAGRRRQPLVIEVNLMDMPAEVEDPHIALQPVAGPMTRCPSYRELEKEFLG